MGNSIAGMLLCGCPIIVHIGLGVCWAEMCGRGKASMGWCCWLALGIGHCSVLGLAVVRSSIGVVSVPGRGGGDLT